MKLNKNERIDDLEYKGLKLIQNSEGFCFGMDAILLSDFAKDLKVNSKVMDMGTGTGIIATLLCEKTQLSEIIGIEIQEEVYEMAKRSISLNKLENKFKIINDNINNLHNIFIANQFDCIVTNPPYKKNGTGLKNENILKNISRHEIEATLDDFIKQSKFLLKDKGEIYMVHRPERLIDIICIMRKYKIEPKEIRFVAPNINAEPNLVLIKGVKNAKDFLKVLKPLYIYNEDGKYTDEVLKIYGKGEY